VQRDLALQQAKDSKKAGAIPTQREAPIWDERNQRVVVEEIPDPIRRSMAAREAYLRDVPPACDSEDRTPNYAFYTGDRYFAYGHFEEARRLLAPIYEQRCTTSPMGFVTWRELLQMSNMEQDHEQSRRLAEAERDHPCAGERPASRGDMRPEVLVNAAFDDAAVVLEAAARAPEGPKRERLLRKGAKMYEDAVRAAPAHRDAPLAAMRSASTYLQIGEVNRAIDVYRLFIHDYTDPATLDLLKHGGTDLRTVPPTILAPQPDAYKERFENLAAAYDALASAYLTRFAYGPAAAVLAEFAENARFDLGRRSKAARIAMKLYSGLGDRAGAARMHDVATGPDSQLTPGERAEVDYLLASFDFGQWSQGGSTAANEGTRLRAVAALIRFHEAHRSRPASAPYALEAAYRIAKMKQSARDATFRAWFKATLEDWRCFASQPRAATDATGKPSLAAASDAPYVDYREEAELAVRESQLAAYPFGPPGIIGVLAPMVLPAPSPQP
jgi:tetratricopeptide (TPR) repeat protein